jgi:hypothetical protein
MKDAEKKYYRVQLTEYFTKLLKWLQLNLKNKAENGFSDEHLRAIFLLNNFYKLSKLFASNINTSSGLLSPQNGSSLNSPYKRALTQINLVSMNGSHQQDQHKCATLHELYSFYSKFDMKAYYDNEILNQKREYSKWFDLIFTDI